MTCQARKFREGKLLTQSTQLACNSGNCGRGTSFQEKVALGAVGQVWIGQEKRALGAFTEG